MDARRWFKFALFLLYVGGVVFLLNKCSRVVEPETPATAPRIMPGKDDAKPEQISADERRRIAEQEEHAKRAAERLAAHQRREAELKMMRETRLPTAIAELAEEATRYRNKLPDLQRLSQAEGWEREEPVKETLARAKRLMADYYLVDKEAQQGRARATEYLDDEVALLVTRIAAFKRGGEDISNYAAALPVFIGHVSFDLMTSALEAIAQVVLPADAFNSCRNPALCPKPAEPAKETEPPKPTARTQSILSPKKSLHCVVPNTRAGDRFVFDRPETSAGVIAALRPNQCLDAAPRSFEDTDFQEVDFAGQTAWVKDGVLQFAQNLPINYWLLPARDPHTGRPLRLCVNPLTRDDVPLPLYPRPNATTPPVALILPTSCRLVATGGETLLYGPKGPIRWLQVRLDDGPTGWVDAAFLRVPKAPF